MHLSRSDACTQRIVELLNECDAKLAAIPWCDEGTSRFLTRAEIEELAGQGFPLISGAVRHGLPIATRRV